MNPPHGARGLVRDSLGIWISQEFAHVSYPQNGNQQCFQVEDRSFWFQHRNDCIVAAVHLFPPTGPILDVGGGNGFVTRRLLNEGFDSHLIEPGPEGVVNARLHRKIPTIIRSTLEECRFPPGSIDAIGLFDVLEHIEDDAEFLETIHRLLKPNGRFYLTVPAYKWLWSTSDVEAGHFRRYSPETLRAAISKRFRIELSTCFFGMLTIPIVALRVIPYLLGRRRSPISPRAEHGTDSSFTVKVLHQWLSREVKGIKKRSPQAVGTSCLCVATKIEPTVR